jgi:hypothetical protein
MHDELFEALRRRIEENQRLFDSLQSATEFTVTNDHLTLLRHAYADSWDPGEGHFGAVGINSKRPYGDSYVTRSIAEILNAPDEDWEYEDGEKAGVTDEAEERFTRLHIETMAALQIVLAVGEFRPGRYRRSTTWDLDWQCDDSGE